MEGREAIALLVELAAQTPRMLYVHRVVWAASWAESMGSLEIGKEVRRREDRLKPLEQAWRTTRWSK